MIGVAMASALGAVARYVLERAIRDRSRSATPMGTIAVNVSGSLALGFISGLALFHGLSPDLRAVVGTGFVGSYTTFSAFAYETSQLMGQQRATAVRYVIVSVAGGLAASGLGLFLAGWR